ncbi:MAG: hypothetical protein LBK62_09270 [Treponema sp.]|jgi:hypothetical protein|nr:hypothetical protein [Treponema sp.]
MKSKLFYKIMIGIVLVGSLVFDGCMTEVPTDQVSSLPSTKGKFTLTGASNAEKQYAFIMTKIQTETILLGITDSNTDGSKLKGAQIKNGTVSIPLYICGANGEVKGYSADDTANIKIFISDQKELEQEKLVQTEKYFAFSNVTFAGGKATKDVGEAYTTTL